MATAATTQRGTAAGSRPVPGGLPVREGACYRRGLFRGCRDVERRPAGETPAPHGDEELLVRIASGDRGALASLYDRWAPPLLALAVRLVRERREAEDLLHDVFVEVWQKSGTYDPARGTVRAWLLVRLRSRALDRVKSAAVSRAAPLEAAAERARDADPSLAPDRARVRAALEALPAPQRAVLELGYFDGLSSSEMAARLDVPVGTVKSRVAAALAKLREKLRGGAGGEP